MIGREGGEAFDAVFFLLPRTLASPELLLAMTSPEHPTAAIGAGREQEPPPESRLEAVIGPSDRRNRRQGKKSSNPKT